MKTASALLTAVFLVAGCATNAPPTEPAGVSASAALPKCEAETFDVYFEQGHTDLTDEAATVLQTVGQRYSECDLSLIEIEGHADTDGAADVNLAVSESRAQSVNSALSEMGVDAERVRIIPLGERQALNADGEEKPLNRKTVVRIVP